MAIFSIKPAADLAAISQTLRYVMDSPAEDLVAGFLLPESLILLETALARREGDFRRLPGRRDQAIAHCAGLRIHAETVRLSWKGSCSDQQKRRDLSRLITRLERHSHRIDPRRRPRRRQAA